MSEVPSIVLRCSRFTLYAGVIWIVQGIQYLTADENLIETLLGFALLATGLLWGALYLASSVTITESLVIVRHGIFQDIYQTQTFIDGELATKNGWPKGIMLNGKRVRAPFLIRPNLILESIMQLKGLEPPARKEPAFHGRQRSLL